MGKSHSAESLVALPSLFWPFFFSLSSLLTFFFLFFRFLFQFFARVE